MNPKIKYLAYTLVLLTLIVAYRFVRETGIISDGGTLELVDFSAIVVFGYIFIRISYSIIDNFLKKKVVRPTRKMITKIWSYAIWIVLILLGVGTLTKSMPTVGLSIGLLSAGLAFAMQQPVLCIAGWIILMIKGTYKIGDRIVVNGTRGDVLDITIMYTILRELGEFGEETSGEVITIPNSWILQYAILNYSAFNLKWGWDEEIVYLSYDSDCDKAEKLLIAAVDSVLADELKDIKPKDLEFLGVSSTESMTRRFLKRDGIEVSVRHITRSLDRRRIKSELSKAMLHTIKKNPKVIKLAN